VFTKDRRAGSLKSWLEAQLFILTQGDIFEAVKFPFSAQPTSSPYRPTQWRKSCCRWSLS